MVDDPEIDRAVAHGAAAILALGEADHLAGQCLGKIDLGVPPSDGAVGANPPQRVAGRIFGLARHAVPTPWRERVMLGRRAVGERCVRSLLVVDALEVTEPVELLAQATRRGVAVSRSSVRCSRSSRPFCCGLPGAMRSGSTPALITLTASRERPPAPLEANGGPLSERSRSGSPYSRNAASSTGQTCSVSLRLSAWQRKR